ncbi:MULTISPECIES: SDR family NAD(P)-dependent oxidoreductase [Lacticaseibacillus]|uniref:Short-chain alcohol dehydrogenase n=1 Tax=Lacticaseibacillus casei DSM 20011 = JCM 1134 = ATCC 393 TaxID=1423732 RepID=A0AAD1ESF7_LACCA|nr:SDR family NAD(P)-dependent oxidoreductase [Lacticaseibacillus casei]MBI6597088.1 SDR family NAD(P)-dependent oxidoreductase [Lacticaseibacillus casei]MBO1480784.1 SDR family NAD(P)-dependent oxidoreductase [Lacticaseibacillus casei]MBO2416100.1 SDR family NAD(P)-dependent oxidoreductase [Lacticaseibacillus casei]MCK2080516.1 SDR family NAD(P)-dependent oxidoreductase [Lacticaseibacillus casei]MDZ5496823.1 SDR family NAD(P)-dependent oxidoreductase [Lacticaseibacillus casei]
MQAPKRHWTERDMPDLTGRYAVVTGGTSGVGFAMSASLLRHGATVIIIGKNRLKGQAAVETLKQQTQRQLICFIAADLSDQTAVNQLADELLATLPRLDILINNAGVMMPAERTVTRDGVELMWAVNYFAGFMLTLRLSSLLEKTPNARVVNVASIAMGRPHLTFDQFDGRHYRPWTFYANSKLAQAMMAVKLNQLFHEAGQSVMVNGSSPGLAATSLKTIQSRTTAWPMRLAALSFRIMPWLRQSPQRAALPVLYAATDAHAQGGVVYAPASWHGLRGYPGLWSWNSRPELHDQDLLNRLYRASRQVTGV